MPNSNVLVTANWKRATAEYKVSHWLQNLENDEYTQNATETLTATVGSVVRSDPESYDGFSATASTQTAIVLTDGSLEIKHYYNRLKYDVFFFVDSVKGQITDDFYFSVKYGAQISIPDVTAINGYKFENKWHDFSGNDVTVETTVKEDAFYYAQFVRTFTLRYDANGGSGTAPDLETYDEGVIATLNENMFTPPDGYIFKEWNTKADGTGWG